MPIEKNSVPLPVMTTAWTSSSAARRSTTLCRVISTSRVSRFWSAGRSSVMVTTDPSRSNRTSSEPASIALTPIRFGSTMTVILSSTFTSSSQSFSADVAFSESTSTAKSGIRS